MGIEKIRQFTDKPITLGGFSFIPPKPLQPNKSLREKIVDDSKEEKRMRELAKRSLTFDFQKELPDSTQKTIKSLGGADIGTTTAISGFEQSEETEKARLFQFFSEQQGKGFGPGAAKLTKSVLQETARSGGAVGLTLATPFVGTQEIRDEDLTPTELKYKNIIFGKDPVKSIQTRIAEAEIRTQKFGRETGIASIEKGALPLSVIGVVGMIGLDFTTGGGKDDVVKFLAKTDKAGDIINMLRKINVAEDLITDYAPVIAKAKKTDDIVKILDNITDIQKTTKTTKVTETIKAMSKSDIEKELKKTDKALNKALQRGTGNRNPQEIIELRERSERFKSALNEATKGTPKTTGTVSPFLPEQFTVAKGIADDFVGLKITKSEFTERMVKAFPNIDKTTIESMTDQARIFKDLDVPKTQKVKEIVSHIQGSIERLPAPKTRKFLTSVEKARPDVPLKVGGQYIPRSTDDLAIKAKNLIIDNIDKAETIARTRTDDTAIATASELIKHYSDEAAKASNQATRDALLDKASEVAHLTASNLTEHGRAVQAASIMGKQTPEGFLRFAAREINKHNDAVVKSGFGKTIDPLSSKQVADITTEFNKIQKMTDGTQKAIATKELTNSIGNLIPSSLLKKVISIWKAGLLTGIKTSGLNTMSNLFHGVSEIVKDVPGAAVDSVMSLFTGKRTLGLTLRGKGGIKEGFEKGWRYFTTGFDERNIAAKLDYHKVNFGDGPVAKTLQRYEETVFHLLGAEDQPFFYGAKARSLYSQAIAKSKNAGKKGKEATKFIENLVKNPTDDMLRRAVGDAEMAVFQNQTSLGKIAKAIQSTGVGEIVVPFGRTPSAVAMQFVNYSPVGVVKSITGMIRKGKFDQRLFSQEVGRGLVGTAVLYLGTELYKNDLITTGYPEGERERKLWEAEGKKPNSIKIGGKWRSVAIVGPAGYVLVAGASYQENFDETGSQVKALGSMTFGGVKSLADQTFLQGIKQVTSAIDDPGRYGSGYFSNLAGSIIPTIIGDVAKTIDTKERRTTESFWGRAKSKLPGIRQTLEPKVDILGKERARGGNWLETMIDPGRPVESIETPVLKELRRLMDLDFDIAPTQLGDKTGYDVLTPEETTILWKKTGTIINSKLGNLIEMGQYKKLEDDQKAEVIEDIVQLAKDNARAEIVLELTDGLEGQALKNKLAELKESGLMTREVFKIFLELVS